MTTGQQTDSDPLREHQLALATWRHNPETVTRKRKGVRCR